ncbi:hypothetical protein B0T18DRAFT_423004 [Schizothecium vesticola]|uniref:CENP-V/GFA domain-containing protein n=1 Tax=Schizothecium vesticola TaxID=314040 RepID=A0AA40BR29_9PEZI|nr:hypothetical protein B0T18DRAFT_423004 [Schizothecium vesticola]
MSTSPSTSLQPKQLKGNCHCGRFRFLLPANLDLDNLITCACTLCSKLGCLWLRGVATGAFTVTRKEESLVEYQGLRFCGNCGTAVTGDYHSGALKGEVLVNVRAVWGFNPFEHDLGSITQIPAPADEVRSLPSLLPSSVEGETAPPVAHHGSCHCGKVRVELLVDIGTLEIKEDNCSSCVRNAYIGIYPTKSQVRIHGGDNTFEYLYGRKYNGAAHCRTCGVLVFNNVYGPPVSVFDRLPPERKEKVLATYWKNLAMRPLNVRALDDVDVGALKVQREDEGTEGYALVD